MGKRIGILTGGGDCPGLNGVIRAVVKKGERDYGYEFIGFIGGWKGVLENNTMPLKSESVRGILQKGGTILKSSRTNPYKLENGVARVEEALKACNLDALIAIGGDDTLGVASKLYEDGINTIGVPKTIDNDLSCTDYTFGFNTAVSIVCDALDRLQTTAESHDRVLVCEVMGRHAGWIATIAGIAGGADYICIPEQPFDINDICNVLKNRHEHGKSHSVIVVAEGASFKDNPEELVTLNNEVDAFGHSRLGGIGNIVAELIKKRTGYDTRCTILGHIQRGGTPTVYDRYLATMYGIKAIELVNQGDFGKMVALHGTEIVAVPIKEAVGELKTVPPELYNIAKTFFN